MALRKLVEEPFGQFASDSGQKRAYHDKREYYVDSNKSRIHVLSIRVSQLPRAFETRDGPYLSLCIEQRTSSWRRKFLPFPDHRMSLRAWRMTYKYSMVMYSKYHFFSGRPRLIVSMYVHVCVRLLRGLRSTQGTPSIDRCRVADDPWVYWDDTQSIITRYRQYFQSATSPPYLLG